jgi:pseudaminic acid cytidylyltransferase
MSCIAILPARGGSKRIPKKNIKDFCGKPMIAYPIEAAIRSKLFEHIIVSTDDDEIAAVAREYGADTPFTRPPELSEDYTGSHAVMVHAIRKLQELGFALSHICKIFPASPLISEEDLTRGLQLLKTSDADFAMAVVEFPYPIDRALQLTDDGRLIMRWPENFAVRSQDLPRCVHEAGQFVWGTASAFLSGPPPLLSPLTVPLILPRHRVQDIDTPEDWQQAELIYRITHETEPVRHGQASPNSSPQNTRSKKPAPSTSTTPAVRRNEFGFFEVVQKPSAEALNHYYASKYYQHSIRTHRPTYSSEEITYRKNKLQQKLLVAQRFFSADHKRFLDIGAGEGFSLAFYKELGWDVTGLDFSEFGCMVHNPDCLPHLMIGDIHESIAQLKRDHRSFDLVLIDNVLEHVLNPLDLLRGIRSILSPSGVLIVEVPNDFSTVQTQLLAQGRLSRPFWVVIPDHLSYFNRDGLISVAKAAGLDEEIVLADFPIDFALFNDRTNYVNDPSAGESCHRMRLEIDNLMHRVSPDKTNAYYQALADLGLGRQIIGFFRPSSGNA